MENPITQNPIPEPVQPVVQTPSKTNNSLVALLSVLLLIAVAIAGLFYFQILKLSKELVQVQVQVLPTPTPTAENEVFGIQVNTCCSCPTKIDKSLIGTDGWVVYEKGKNYSQLLPECDLLCQPCPPLEEENQNKINCKDPRPEVCTMECIENPPYICGSDGKSYCTVCQACSNKNVAWYEMKNSPCEEQ
mgnify:FL=1